MAKKRILASKQEKILNLVSKKDYLIQRFYLTDSTPLGVFYLFHRISEDLDFLTKKKSIC